MIYSKTAIFDETFDCDSMEVGDSFHMNGTCYKVERKFNEGPFMSFTNTAKTLFIISTEHNGQTFYQVCTWSGDWEGCHPVSDSIEGALFSELARLNEIMDQDEAIEEGLVVDTITAAANDMEAIAEYATGKAFTATLSEAGEGIEVEVLAADSQGFTLRLGSNGHWTQYPTGG